MVRACALRARLQALICAPCSAGKPQSTECRFTTLSLNPSNTGAADTRRKMSLCKVRRGARGQAAEVPCPIHDKTQGRQAC
jgi:hypothetical protein